MKSPVRSHLGLLGSAAALVAAGLLVGGPAWAQTFDTSGATITCNTFLKTAASIKPPVTAASTGTAVTKVSGKLYGCTVTGATPSNPTIVSGSIKGALNTSGSPGCAGLLAPSTITGNLVVKWKAASGQTLDFTSTTVSGGTITGGVFAPGGSYQAAYGQFSLSGQTIQPNSAFAGGTPSATAATSEDVGVLAGQCVGTGVKKVTLAIGTIVL